uniref:PHD-type domain-containing protein n=1 Tax=Chromera velia CCMP2878 TaxID=1169474 RepID=A0A0G4ICR6_9ALVE|eukprot:Cvel_13107.t1-p1 / transcript=Cvel_13107.t1 / gene=Cvel_13107 / organism=Chromera_velia_CCMP2878 / gene_product=hypothetical protein / transcript_product=hypothetical protein / location=Cvel_scaffold883:30439-35492(+) / protein_length=852 / sequence_SO=supercontig / SO=protein_coding / is_pseudo=false
MPKRGQKEEDEEVEEEQEVEEDSGDEEDKDYVCLHCGTGGQLLCCDYCSRSFHVRCLGLPRVPKGKEWCCSWCEGGEYKVKTKAYKSVESPQKSDDATSGTGLKGKSLSVLLQWKSTLTSLEKLCLGGGKFPPNHAFGHLGSQVFWAQRYLGLAINHGLDVREEFLGVDMAGVSRYVRRALDGLSVSDVHRKELQRVGGRVSPECKELWGKGYVTLKECLSQKEVEGLYNEVVDAFNKYMGRINSNDSLRDQLENGGGFDLIKTRGALRFDVSVPALLEKKEKFKGLHAKTAKWLRVCREALRQREGDTGQQKDDLELCHVGCMLTRPSCAIQDLHTDGPHDAEAAGEGGQGGSGSGASGSGGGKGEGVPRHEAPYALNVFLPLVNVRRDVGPTEFHPGSHFLWNYWGGGDEWANEQRGAPEAPLLKAGDALVFDYRILHRGLGNRSGIVRPVIYLTYCRKGDWKERDANFDAKRYPPLFPQQQQKGKETAGERGKTAARPISVTDDESPRQEERERPCSSTDRASRGPEKTPRGGSKTPRGGGETPQEQERTSRSKGNRTPRGRGGEGTPLPGSALKRSRGGKEVRSQSASASSSASQPQPEPPQVRNSRKGRGEVLRQRRRRGVSSFDPILVDSSPSPPPKVGRRRGKEEDKAGKSKSRRGAAQSEGLSSSLSQLPSPSRVIKSPNFKPKDSRRDSSQRKGEDRKVQHGRDENSPKSTASKKAKQKKPHKEQEKGDQMIPDLGQSALKGPLRLPIPSRTSSQEDLHVGCVGGRTSSSLPSASPLSAPHRLHGGDRTPLRMHDGSSLSVPGGRRGSPVARPLAQASPLSLSGGRGRPAAECLADHSQALED